MPPYTPGEREFSMGVEGLGLQLLHKHNVVHLTYPFGWGRGGRGFPMPGDQLSARAQTEFQEGVLLEFKGAWEDGKEGYEGGRGKWFVIEVRIHLKN